MSENLENFLVDVSSNPNQRSRFSTNPHDVLAQSALNETERAQVLSKDSQVLADALGATGYSLGQIIDEITPMRAPGRRKRPARKTPPKRKAPKGPARKKAPARRKSPAKRKAPATKKSPARKNAPAKRAPAKKSPRKSTSRKRR